MKREEKINEIMNAGIYSNVFYNNPRKVFQIINDLVRIPNYDYSDELVDGNYFYDYPVFILENKSLLDELFWSIPDYILRLDEDYPGRTKEVDYKACIGLTTLAEDFKTLHNIDIFLYESDDGQGFYLDDPDNDANFDYYYKMETEEYRRQRELKLEPFKKIVREGFGEEFLKETIALSQGELIERHLEVLADLISLNKNLQELADGVRTRKLWEKPEENCHI